MHNNIYRQITKIGTTKAENWPKKSNHFMEKQNIVVDHHYRFKLS